MKSQSRMGIPARRKDVFFVRSPKKLEVIKFRIFSESMYSVYTHYNGRTTVPCYLNRELCDPKHSTLNLRWKGYVFGFNDTKNALEWLQFTHECANQLADQLAGAQSLTGLVVQVSRTNSNQGRQNCALLESQYHLDRMKLRADPPLRISLFNLWGLEANNLPFTTSIEELHLGPAELKLAE